MKTNKYKISEEISRKKRFNKETVKIYESALKQIKEDHELPDLDELNDKINVILDALGLEYDKEDDKQQDDSVTEDENSEQQEDVIDNVVEDVDEVVLEDENDDVKENIQYSLTSRQNNLNKTFCNFESLINYISDNSFCSSFELQAIEENNECLSSGVLIKNAMFTINKISD